MTQCITIYVNKETFSRNVPSYQCLQTFRISLHCGPPVCDLEVFPSIHSSETSSGLERSCIRSCRPLLALSTSVVQIAKSRTFRARDFLYLSEARMKSSKLARHQFWDSSDDYLSSARWWDSNYVRLCSGVCPTIVRTSSTCISMSTGPAIILHRLPPVCSAYTAKLLVRRLPACNGRMVMVNQVSEELLNKDSA